VAITGEVARLAHMVGASVEGELGCLGSLETGMGEAEDGHGFEGALDHAMLLTDPDEAARFVAETQVDALAVALGTSHGAYKFSRKPTGDILAMDVIERIHARLPNTHIVMHGSSSVPEEWQEIFNAHGGEMRETYGVPVEELIKGIRMGVRKVNIDTDLRLAAAAEFRRVAVTRPDEFDPRKFLKPSMDAMASICRARFEAFGTAGQAGKIRVIPLADMARRYASGSLAPAHAPTLAAA
jgi:fructose-bisphosphate aldolase class II